MEHYKNENYVEWEKTLRVAFSFLDKGFLINPEKVAKAFYDSIDQIIPALNYCYQKRKKAEFTNDEDQDAKIENYLSAYKIMYERLVTLVMAPVVCSFAVSRKIRDQSFKLPGDGRIGLHTIKKMEKWLIYPQNRLKIGLNSHVRNAFSHERYQILDNGKVKLWDKNIRRKKKWGPETWDIDRLKNLCDLLWQNTLAVICALALFSINNRELMVARNWGRPNFTPSLRLEELESTLKHYADKLSFEFKGLEKKGSSIHLILHTKLRGVDQESVVLVGSTPPRRYKVPIRYVETTVAEQALGYIQQIGVYLSDFEKLFVTLFDTEKVEIGKMTIRTENIKNIAGPKYSTVEADRKILEEDSVADAIMYRKDEYPAYED